MKIYFEKITDVEIDGIDTKDYPDFVDAYMSSANYKGKPMSYEMIEYINENFTEWVYFHVLNEVF